MYEAVTGGIKVSVTPYFLEEQSTPEDDHYVWAYQISIENQGGETVQLRNRFWRITNAMGHVEEIEGPGVVGEQPVLKPGETFQYTSGAPLATASGIMMGSYEMEGPDGRMFDVTIPAFSLDSPHQPVQLN
jgi:ApaG protein